MLLTCSGDGGAEVGTTTAILTQSSLTLNVATICAVFAASYGSRANASARHHLCLADSLLDVSRSCLLPQASFSFSLSFYYSFFSTGIPLSLLLELFSFLLSLFSHPFHLRQLSLPPRGSTVNTCQSWRYSLYSQASFSLLQYTL